jgi:hypothetical protein
VVPTVHGGIDEPATLQSLCAVRHRVKTSRLDRRIGIACWEGESQMAPMEDFSTLCG